MTKETRNHYIYDETLKVEREYGEVPYGNEDGEAAVGDFVIITGKGHTREGFAFTIEKFDHNGDVVVDGDLEDSWTFAELHEVTKLSPTGNVRLASGETYTLSDRKATVGDRVLITNPFLDYYGKVIDVSEVDGEGDVVIERHSHGGYGYVAPSDFRVLTPLESAEPAPQAPPNDTADLLANLVRRMSEQERKTCVIDEYTDHLIDANIALTEKYEALTKEMASIRRDLQTFAEVAETAKHTAEQNRSKPKEVARKVIDDINEYYAKGGCV